MKLSPHFDSREFRSADGVGVPAGHARELRSLCRDYLEPLRSEFGPVEILSGFRSAKHNAHVGGVPQSRHLAVPGRRGAAADLRCAQGTPAEWYRFLDRMGIGGLGLYSWGIHADNRQTRARW